MNKRIICFVDNTNGNTGKGLIHIFGSKSKENNEFCKEFLYYINDSDEFKIILGNENKYFLLFSKEKGAKLANSISENDDWDMLWVHDSQSVNTVKDVFTSETYVLYHNKPDNAEKDLSQLNIAGKKHGQHEPEDEYYKHLKNFIESWSPNNTENDGYTGAFDTEKYDAAEKKIFAEFDSKKKLDVALEFLHGCLINKSENYAILQNAGIKTDELPAMPSANVNTESEEYNKWLSDVRDKVLELAIRED